MSLHFVALSDSPDAAPNFRKISKRSGSCVMLLMRTAASSAKKYTESRPSALHNSLTRGIDAKEKRDPEIGLPCGIPALTAKDIRSPSSGRPTWASASLKLATMAAIMPSGSCISKQSCR